MTADSIPRQPDFPQAAPYPGNDVDRLVDQAGGFVADATDWGLVEASGADAEAFLHGQLSSDVQRLARGRGQWTSYNSAKGRMLADGFLCRMPGEPPRFLLALAADLAEPIGKRLAMFVLRSKVTIADRTPALARLGVGGVQAQAIVQSALAARCEPGAALEVDGATLIHLPEGRVLAFTAKERGEDLLARIAAHAPKVDAERFRWLGIRAGVPLVTLATQDAVLPQEANLDLLGAVVLSRDKGCFPGQEVIKRTQALGRLKERLYAFEADAAPPSPGERLYGDAFGDQPCGTVINAARAPSGRTEFLAVAQIAALAEPMRLGAFDGPVIGRLELPYPVPQSVTPPRS